MSIPNEIKSNMDRLSGIHRVMIQAFWIYIWAAVFSGNVYLDLNMNDYASMSFWKPMIITAFVTTMISSLIAVVQNLNYLKTKHYPISMLTWLFVGIMQVFMWVMFAIII